MVKRDEPSSEDIVSQADQPVPESRPIWRRRFGRKTLLMVIVVVLVIVVGGLAGWWWLGRDNQADQQVTNLLSQSQGLKAYADKTKEQAPAANATATEKADYYKTLELALAGTKDYAGASKAFEQREQYGKDDLVYYDYLRAADYYVRLNNKTAALSALDRAEALLPPKDDDSTGFSRSSVLDSIKQYREALK